MDETTPSQSNTTAITVTQGAETFMRRMVRFGGLGPGAGFRLVVSPGGCSGLHADFSVHEEPPPGDEILVVNGFRVFLPSASARLLAGGTVDFADTMSSPGLVLRTQNAPSSCGEHGQSGLVQASRLTRR